MENLHHSKIEVATAIDGESASEVYENYADYNRSLRTWFVTFGVGGPSLFLINKDIATRLHASGNASLVVSLFLVGCALQVFVALLNKTCAWHLYDAKRNSAHERNGWYKFWIWLEKQYWIDLSIDVATAVFFGVAVAATAAAFLRIQ